MLKIKVCVLTAPSIILPRMTSFQGMSEAKVEKIKVSSFGQSSSGYITDLTDCRRLHIRYW